MNESTYVTPRNSDQSGNFLRTGSGKDSRTRYVSAEEMDGVVIKSLQVDIRDYSSTQTETRTENLGKWIAFHDKKIKKIKKENQKVQLTFVIGSNILRLRANVRYP